MSSMWAKQAEMDTIEFDSRDHNLGHFSLSTSRQPLDNEDDEAGGRANFFTGQARARSMYKKHRGIAGNFVGS